MSKEVKLFVIRNKITGEYYRQWMHKTDSLVKIYHKESHAKAIVTREQKHLDDYCGNYQQFWKNVEVVECTLSIPPLKGK